MGIGNISHRPSKLLVKMKPETLCSLEKLGFPMHGFDCTVLSPERL